MSIHGANNNNQIPKGLQGLSGAPQTGKTQQAKFPHSMDKTISEVSKDPFEMLFDQTLDDLKTLKEEFNHGIESYKRKEQEGESIEDVFKESDEEIKNLLSDLADVTGKKEEDTENESSHGSVNEVTGHDQDEQMQNLDAVKHSQAQQASPEPAKTEQSTSAAGVSGQTTQKPGQTTWRSLAAKVNGFIQRIFKFITGPFKTKASPDVNEKTENPPNAPLFKEGVSQARVEASRVEAPKAQEIPKIDRVLQEAYDTEMNFSADVDRMAAVFGKMSELHPEDKALQGFSEKLQDASKKIKPFRNLLAIIFNHADSSPKDKKEALGMLLSSKDFENYLDALKDMMVLCDSEYLPKENDYKEYFDQQEHEKVYADLPGMQENGTSRNLVRDLTPVKFAQRLPRWIMLLDDAEKNAPDDEKKVFEEAGRQVKNITHEGNEEIRDSQSKKKMQTEIKFIKEELQSLEQELNKLTEDPSLTLGILKSAGRERVVAQKQHKLLFFRNNKNTPKEAFGKALDVISQAQDHGFQTMKQSLDLVQNKEFRSFLEKNPEMNKKFNQLMSSSFEKSIEKAITRSDQKISSFKAELKEKGLNYDEIIFFNKGASVSFKAELKEKGLNYDDNKEAFVSLKSEMDKCKSTEDFEELKKNIAGEGWEQDIYDTINPLISANAQVKELKEFKDFVLKEKDYLPNLVKANAETIFEKVKDANEAVDLTVNNAKQNVKDFEDSAGKLVKSLGLNQKYGKEIKRVKENSNSIIEESIDNSDWALVGGIYNLYGKTKDINRKNPDQSSSLEDNINGLSSVTMMNARTQDLRKINDSIISGFIEDIHKGHIRPLLQDKSKKDKINQILNGDKEPEGKKIDLEALYSNRAGKSKEYLDNVTKLTEQLEKNEEPIIAQQASPQSLEQEELSTLVGNPGEVDEAPLPPPLTPNQEETVEDEVPNAPSELSKTSSSGKASLEEQIQKARQNLKNASNLNKPSKTPPEEGPFSFNLGMLDRAKEEESTVSNNPETLRTDSEWEDEPLEEARAEESVQAPEPEEVQKPKTNESEENQTQNAKPTEKPEKVQTQNDQTVDLRALMQKRRNAVAGDDEGDDEEFDDQ